MERKTAGSDAERQTVNPPDFTLYGVHAQFYVNTFWRPAVEFTMARTGTPCGLPYIVAVLHTNGSMIELGESGSLESARCTVDSLAKALRRL